MQRLMKIKFAKDRREHVRAALHRDADQVAGDHAARAQGCGDPARALFKFDIAQAQFAEFDRAVLRRARGLGEEQGFDAPRLERGRRRLQGVQFGGGRGREHR